tara:strand:+ start:1543 stop:1845 length:303 start_codon:yes stop_codon:yes gene_type:complete
MVNTILHNPHPGEILKIEFLDGYEMSQAKLADYIGVSRSRINQIVSGKRSITPDTDLRLCKFFGLSDGYFLRLQNIYDLMNTKIYMGDVIDAITPLNQAR